MQPRSPRRRFYISPVLIIAATLTFGASLAAGCGGIVEDKTFDIIHDPCEPLIIETPSDATVAELSSVDDAIGMWNGFGVTKLTTDPDIEGARIPLHFEGSPIAFFGVYDDEIGEITVNREIGDRRARAIVIAHEVGHAYGLTHIERSERSSVMNKANKIVAPTPADAEMLAGTGVGVGCATLRFLTAGE